MNLKSAVTNPFLIALACFLIFMFAVNQILNLAKPSKTMFSDYAVTNSLFNSAYMMASAPNVSYKEITNSIHQKFPNIPEASVKVGINPEIAKLPDQDQGNAIKLSIIDSRLSYLEEKIATISQSGNENLLFKIGFYFWGFIAWVASVVLGHMLTHVTTRINTQYIDQWLDKKLPKQEL